MSVQTKKMDENYFAKLVKEFNAVGELIRARQDEKQSVIDEFDSESKRFYFGKISEKTLASSIAKTNRELKRLDNEIRKAIAKVSDIGIQARKFASAQSPKAFKATLSKVVQVGEKSKKKSSKKKPKKPVKKKAGKKKSLVKKSKKKVKRLSAKVKKKEIALDKKFQLKKKK